MKKVRKILGLMMCLVLAFGCLTGCGGKSEEEVFMGAITSLNTAKSFDMEATMSGKMSMQMEEESQDIDISSKVVANCFTDPYKMKATTTTTTMGQSTSQEVYMQKEDEKYVLYMNTAGTWSKMELGDLDAAIQASGINNIESQLSGDINKYTKKENKEEGEKTYLVYDYTVSGDEMKKMAEGMTSSLGTMLGDSTDSKDLEEMIDKMLETVGDVTMTILVDKEEGCVARIEYPMTDMMNNMLNSMMKYMAEKFGESEEKDTVGIAEALASVKIQVSDMNMVTTYKNLDNAAEFEIPEEAKNAKPISSLLEDSSEDSEK